MKKLLIALTLLFSLNGFAQETKCEKFTDITTKTIAVTLNCRSEMSIRTSVEDLAYKMGACPQPEDKGLVCFVAAKAGVYLVQKQIPIQWLCKPDIAMKVLEVSLNKVCTSITGL